MIRTTTAKLTLALCLLITGGCVQYTLVEPGTNAFKGVSANFTQSWNKTPFDLGPNTTVLTADGLPLNRIFLISGVEPGKPLFKDTNKDTPMPRFKEGLLPHEMADLMQTSLTNLRPGAITLEMKALRPHQLDGNPGIAFDYSYFDEQGLLVNGRAVSAVHNGKFFGAVFEAPAMHYFGYYSEQIDQLFASLDVQERQGK